jgi:vitamin B12 transporter
MRLRLSVSACIAALAWAFPALAEEAPTPLDEAVVTVARLPTTPADAPGLRVVTAEDIETIQATFAADVLTTLPGVSLYSEGAFGGITSLRLRGAATDKTLVLVDGVPMNDPASPSGAFNFSDLSLADIGRIEVLNGPQGSLWGSSAIGGVISFTTRETDGLSAGIEAGAFATVNGWASVGRSSEAHALSASISAYHTDGVSQADAADGNREADGFDTWTAGLAGRVRVSPAVELDGRLRYTDSRVDLDGFPPPLFLLADTDDRSISKTWSGFGRARIEGPWDVTHSLSLSLYDISREAFGSFPGVFTGERQVLRYVAAHDRPGERWGLTGGVEHERIRGDASFADAALSTTSAFAVGRLEATDRLTATLALRYDAPDRFDAESTARASLAAELGGGFRATASFGQGFKTPTVSQVLCDFCFAPPIALAPETAEGWDATLGWRSRDGRVEVSLTGYRLDVKDQIAFVAGRYQNIASTSAEGIEADLRAELGHGFRLRAGYGFTDAVDETTGQPLLRAPRHTGSATLSWKGDDLDAALTLRAESEQLDVVGFATGVRPGFATADLAAGWALNERVKLTARIENLTDAHYQEAAGYGQPGRSAYVGIRLRY